MGKTVLKAPNQGEDRSLLDCMVKARTKGVFFSQTPHAGSFPGISIIIVMIIIIDILLLVVVVLLSYYYYRPACRQLPRKSDPKD